MVLTSCPWCHAGNPGSVRYCLTCGHQAHVPRLLCACPKCAGRHPPPAVAADLFERTAYDPDPDWLAARLARNRVKWAGPLLLHALKCVYEYQCPREEAEREAAVAIAVAEGRARLLEERP